MNSTTQTQTIINGRLFSLSRSDHPKQLDPVSSCFIWHTLHLDELLIFVKGSCRKLTEKEEYTLQTGDVCYNPAYKPHALEVCEDVPYERFVIQFKPGGKLSKLAASIFQGATHINIDPNKYLLPLISRWTEYFHKLPIADFIPFSDNMITELLYLCKMECQSATATPDGTEILLKNALAYIEENWKTIKNLKEISTALFISHSYLYQIFAEKLNTTPKTYLMRKRLDMAQSYLLSGMLPHAVSLSVGFNTYTAFYRSFKAHYGKTPQEVYISKQPIPPLTEKTTGAGMD